MFMKDWRCPTKAGMRELVVTKGRFSIPWNPRTARGGVQVGALDGVINADGSVALLPAFTIAELPSEVTERAGDTATLAGLRSAAFTMRFIIDSGASRGRRAGLSFGRSCTYSLRARDYTEDTSPSGPARAGAGKRNTRSPAHGLANGASCTWSDDCASGHCSSGKCESDGGAKNLGNGMACNHSDDCASGHCSSGKCESDGGAKNLANGAECTFSDDCASGHCSSGKCAED
jgi:hypothetical protein